MLFNREQIKNVDELSTVELVLLVQCLVSYLKLDVYRGKDRYDENCIEIEAPSLEGDFGHKLAVK